VSVATTNDPIDEPAEAFTLELSAPNTAATIADGSGLATITDDDPVPTISVGDVTVVEGATATFTISLSNPSSVDVTFSATTSPGTATSGIDYTTLAPVTITIPAGSTSTTVSVATTNDPIDEQAEAFTLELSVPNTAATIADGSGLATITDDDPTPAISIDDVTVLEGGTAIFTISLSNPSSVDVTFSATTSAGTATSGIDYTTLAPVTITIPAGSTSTTVSVATTNDPIDEPAEGFSLELSAPNAAATIADASGTATITDDDPTPTVAVADATATEGSDLVFVITLSNPSSVDTVVSYATSNGTAASPGDFAGRAGTVTVPAGATTASVAVPTVDDPVDEPTEALTLDVTANGATRTGTGTILDGDVTPAISVADITVVEGATATFTIVLSGPSSTDVTVDVATSDGTATNPADYSAVGTSTVTIPAGSTSVVVSTATTSDLIDEISETFSLRLTAPSANATIGDPVGVATITDDDNSTDAVDDAAITPEDTAVTILVLGNDTDVDGDLRTITAVTQPPLGEGTVVIVPGPGGGSIRFVPAAERSGAVTFTYSITDARGATDTATVTVDVTAVDDPPVAVDDAFATTAGVAITIPAPGVTGNDTDIEGGPLAAAIVAGPTNGTAALAADGSFTYTPAAGFVGTDTFTYLVRDPAGSPSAPATVTIVVAPGPTANPDRYTTDEDRPLTVPSPGVLANDGGALGSAPTVSLVTSTTNGSVQLHADGSFEYTPAHDFTGSDTFTYRVCSGTLGCSIPTTVTITVAPVPDPPVAVDDAVRTDADGRATIPVLTNDSDADGGLISGLVTVTVPPLHGAATVNGDGTLSYIADSTYTGSDRLTYRVCDSTGLCASADVVISGDDLVRPAPVAGPVAAPPTLPRTGAEVVRPVEVALALLALGWLLLLTGTRRRRQDARS
jgi:hypothetical protein